MDKIKKITAGKKTYFIVAVALVYVLAGAILGQEINVEVLTIALTAAGIRDAIK